MRIGIYGGSFHPPHVGHIRGAAFAIEALRLDKLLLIPANIPPHKPLEEDSALQRLQMLRLAAAELEKAEVSDLELHREGVSYTWETVACLRQMYPDARLYLIMGADMFLSFHTWKHPERIREQATLAVLHRGGKGEAQKLLAYRQEQGIDAVLLENPVTEVSSSDLRRLLVFGGAEEFLHPQVLEYIRSHDLYEVNADYRGLSLEALEQTVVGLLKPNRVRHVLGCREAAVALAKRWGADETDAARAALLHDITKALDGPLQLTLCAAFGKILDDFSAHNPKTLHALTGSLVAQRIFGENAAVVSAICSHTTGKADMNLLEKIIYVADYMEPNRDFPGVEELRQLADTDIDKALRRGLEMTLALLKQQGRDISPESRQALQFLIRKEEIDD